MAEHVLVARWYLRHYKGGRKRIRKYLKSAGRIGKYTWVMDPMKAWYWPPHDAAKAMELAIHFKADVVHLSWEEPIDIARMDNGSTIEFVETGDGPIRGINN
jgi:hypothetical protein